LSLAQAAEALGVSPDTVRDWFDAGKLSGYRTPGQHRRISTESIAALQDGAA
jgi:excisionase family DNA binding protein